MFRWLLLAVMPLFLLAGCGDLEPDMQDTRTVILNMDFHGKSSSRSSSSVSASELSQYNTHLILALPSWEYLTSNYKNFYSSFAQGLMNTADKKVSLEIPLNTQMKIFAFLFKENYSMSELFSGTREVGYYGESQSFSIGTNTNSLSLGITLQSTGTDTAGGTGSGGGTDTTAPTVLFSPANGATGVAISDNIIITFSEAVRNIDNTELTVSNIDSLITLKLTNSNGNNITFDATINGDKTVITINPTSNLPNLQDVYVALGATLEDSADNVITAANATFTTMGLQSTVATQPSYNATSNKYVVSTLGHLSFIAQNTNFWDYNYIQTADIDATTTKYWDDMDDTGGATGDKYNDDNDATPTGNNEGFLPIGNVSTNFTGEYDGGGYSISGLTIKRTTTDDSGKYIGLFGYTKGATIRNLGVTNDNITGNEWVGSLVGFSTSSTIIDNCSASGIVVSTYIAGGLVGYSYDNTTIRNSYSKASVNGGSRNYVGGLAGFAYFSTILNSYSTGSVVASSTNRGGLIGAKYISSLRSTTITDSFYDKATSGQSDSGKGTGKTTAQMKTKATFTNWDFDTIWDIDTSGTINDGYPYLR
jgi:hypothetical protein